MSLQLQALGKVRYAPRGSAVSYASRQKKRARRKAQQQQVGPHRPLAVSREGYYSRKNHQAEIRVLRRLQSEGGAGKEGHRPEPPNRHPRSDAPGGEVLPISPSTPIRDQREAA